MKRGIFIILVLFQLSCVLSKFYHLKSVPKGELPSEPNLNGKVILTIAYATTDFNSRGTIVSVDPKTGAWEILATFNWPKEIFGRPDLYDPTFYFDYTTLKLFLSFTDLDGFMLTIDIKSKKIVDPIQPTDPLFVGFINMLYDGKYLKGTVPIANDDGEFSFGQIAPNSKTYKRLSIIPFKSMMDDTEFYDKKTNIFYVQAGYDKRPQRCAPKDWENCFLAIDWNTGELKSAKYTNYTVYNYGRLNSDPSNLLAWVEGFDSYCQHPYNDFLFARVNLLTAEAKPIACINVTIQEEPWESAFNDDESLFVTASRFAQDTQFLVLDPMTGKTLLNSRLDGLAEKLQCAELLYYIWDVAFVPN